MKRDAVVLSPDMRAIICEEVHGSLARHGATVLAVCIGSMHMHVLAKFTLDGKPTFDERGLRDERTSAIDDPVRHVMGLAKQWSAKRLIAEGLVSPGGIWARKGKIVPIKDRGHQLNVYHYILGHGPKEGAAVWSFRDGIDE